MSVTTAAVNAASGTRELAETAVSIKRREAEEKADRRYDANGSVVQRALHAQTVITVVVIGVVALVGILILNQVFNAMPEMSTDEEDPDYHVLAESRDSIMDGAGGAFEFVPIIMLVLLAAVVIAVIQRMRQ